MYVWCLYVCMYVCRLIYAEQSGTYQDPFPLKHLLHHQHYSWDKMDNEVYIYLHIKVKWECWWKIKRWSARVSDSLGVLPLLTYWAPFSWVMCLLASDWVVRRPVSSCVRWRRKSRGAPGQTCARWRRINLGAPGEACFPFPRFLSLWTHYFQAWESFPLWFGFEN